MINLRPYQNEALESIVSNYETGVRRQVVHLPTAAGKTVIFASLIDRAIKKNPSIRVLVLAFSTDHLGQARAKLNMISPGLGVGIVDADHKEFDRQVVISSVQSARVPGNLAQLQAQGFSICIVDECHPKRSRVGSRGRFVNIMDEREIIGFTGNG
jgi:superfamily II DNA or RNA helicase